MLVTNVTTKHTFTLTIAVVVLDRLQQLTPKNIFSFKIPSVSPHTRALCYLCHTSKDVTNVAVR